MYKFTRLLLASTVLSGIAGFGTASAETSALRSEDGRPALLQLAQNQQQQQPSEEDRKKQQQQRQDQRQQRQDQRQQQQQQRQDQRQEQRQQRQEAPRQERQERPDRRQDSQQQQQQRQEQQRQEQQQRQDQQQQRQDQQRQRQDQQRQEQQQRQDQQRQEQQQRLDRRRDQQQPPQQQDQQLRQDRRQDQQQPSQQQGQDRRQDQQQQQRQNQRQDQQQQRLDRRQDQQQQRLDQRQDRQDQRQEQQGRDRGDQRQAPLTRSGVPALQENARPIEPTSKGRGAEVRSSSGQEIRRVDELRNERRQEKQGNRTIIREPDRTIIKEGNRTIIRHDESSRFRLGARDVRVERRGNELREVIVRPGGERIVTIRDNDGYLVRRVRVLGDGREVVIIDNRPRAGVRYGNFFVTLPPPRIRIPQERYIVGYRQAPPEVVYETLMAPPVDTIDRAYTLDEIRYSPTVRDRMPRVDLDTVNFETGSWELSPDQIDKLSTIAEGIKRGVDRNPQEVFLIEGHTDAVGNDDDNLSLSDRRAESVAVALTEQFNIPPENLSTQGYGEQYLKVRTDGPEEANRRVTVRRITPLLAGRNEPGRNEPAPQ